MGWEDGVGPIRSLEQAAIPLPVWPAVHLHKAVPVPHAFPTHGLPSATIASPGAWTLRDQTGQPPNSGFIHGESRAQRGGGPGTRSTVNL